jgi:hypothetical protein
MRDGRYELRVTNELEEAMFLDRVQLVAVDHPRDVDVYPNEGLRSPPRPPHRLYTTRGAHAPKRIQEEPIVRTSIGGYAEPHALTIDIGDAPGRSVLLLTGSTEYAWSSDNVAAAQAGLVMQPPSLQVRDRSGAWTTVIADVGFPVGRPQTIAVDLTGRFIGPSREVRILTTMPIHWERILVDTSDGLAPTHVTRVDAATAALRWRGFSAGIASEDGQPSRFDYARVSASAPWKAIVGRYTRYGDVRPLLRAADDMFVIAGPGDEIALSFDGAAFPPLPAGFTRTFLLYADGFSKEMNIRSATPDAVAPLPFHAMRRYPYGPHEHYPRTAAYRAYQDHYNTRVVTSPVPSLEQNLAVPRR